MTEWQARKTAKEKARRHGGTWVIIRRGDDFKVVDRDTWLREFWTFVDHESKELVRDEDARAGRPVTTEERE
jgi:hypothetical protein